jgi:GNAT superfamily N-acetyltransferase
MIELLPVSPLLLSTSHREGWLDDPETNRGMGFDSDSAGTESLTRYFLDACSSDAVFGVYADSHPVGWVTVAPDAPGSVRLLVFVAPPYRRSGVGRRAVSLVARSLLEDRASTIRRVGASVPEPNHPARAFFRAVGFKREGKRWSDVLIDGEEYDTEGFVMVRSILGKLEEN